MHVRRNSYYSAEITRTRPKLLNLQNSNNTNSIDSLEDLTPHFNNIETIKSSISFTDFKPDHLKPPKYLPPLQPLMHSPKVQRNFVFKPTKKTKPEPNLTFRVQNLKN